MVNSHPLPLVASLPAGLVPAPGRLSLAAARELPAGALVACVEFAPDLLVGALDSVCSPRDGSEPWEISVSFRVIVGEDLVEGGDFWPLAECSALVPVA